MRKPTTGLDLTLLKKAAEASGMSIREMSELFGFLSRTISKYLLKIGAQHARQKTCRACGSEKSLSSFSYKHGDICAPCRRKSWIFSASPAKTTTMKCLKCDRKFEAKLGYGAKPINYICERCNFTNSFLGDEPAACPIKI